jgi:hypothetical protein
MPLSTLAEVIAAIALFAVVTLVLAWVGVRRGSAARGRKLQNAPVRRRAF